MTQSDSYGQLLNRRMQLLQKPSRQRHMTCNMTLITSVEPVHNRYNRQFFLLTLKTAGGRLGVKLVRSVLLLTSPLVFPSWKKTVIRHYCKDYVNVTCSSTITIILLNYFNTVEYAIYMHNLYSICYV